MISDAEYGEIVTREGLLKREIESAKVDGRRYGGMRQAAVARKESAEARLLLYTNHLSADKAEWEAAHPPEEA